MDSLTQIVLGASVGEVVLGRKVGNKAMLYGAIAGTIPDLDVIARSFTDTITANELHRGFTHSIFFALVFAPIFGWIISKIEKKADADWKDWSKLMFWGLFTHPLLDMFTTWGTQLFWPADYRLAFKTIFVIDPAYTLPFLFFTVLAAFRPKGSISRRKLNSMGLQLSCLYLFLITIPLKIYTFYEFKEALKEQKISYAEIETKPSPFNTIMWTANIATDKSYLVGNYSILDDQPIEFRRYPKNYHLLGEIKEYPNFKKLVKISKGWYTITEKEGDLYFNDLRFGTIDPTGNDSRFVFSYKLEVKNGILTATEVEKNYGDASKMMKSLFDRVRGN
ncbi:metal-dependent hydrolase [Zunongwangia sp. HRR-M8]|uniref:metal-dependent hydrolase n=1 Tax=Zunongwangia sp. HRR-M8 TaxID=3015170 RepID=UPI0022DD8D8F|nr:metal-dependent hydrolase [Zunongwangia sp. HRR-M8]WBL22817.1 metal-dependent hydrolase [Zunongwangia sp. HRR-M8]